MLYEVITQTVISDLTALEIANASLLDEATAAAEAMVMLFNARTREQQKEAVSTFFVDENIFPQTRAVLETRAEPLGIGLLFGKFEDYDFQTPVFGTLLQYPAADGCVKDYRNFTQQAHARQCAVVVAADLLGLTILQAPGEWGADVVVGSVV